MESRGRGVVSPPSRRPSDQTWSQVVLWFVALNILDLGLTLHLIERGATEMNPLMASLLDAGWEWAAVFKAIVTVGVGAGLWFGRSHRLVRHSGIAFVVMLAAIMLYQLADVWVA